MSSKKSSDGLNQSVLKCLRGEGTKKDAKNAFRFFHDKAKSNQAQAQFEYGHALFTGFGNDDFKDTRAAIDWLQLAADQNHIEAQFYLAQAYHDGEGVEQDYIMAVHFYTNPAEQGNADAQYQLGRCLSYISLERAKKSGWTTTYSEKIEKNNGQKRTHSYWNRLAAEQGHVEAMCAMGSSFRRKNDAPSLSPEEKLSWMEKAVDQGNISANWKVGMTYLTGEGSLAGKDFKTSNSKAFKVTKAAAKQGHAEAQYFIGDAYATGIGIEVNKQKSVKWFYLAATNEKGMDEADILFSYYHHLKSDILGGLWYPKVHAHFRLGEAYLKGEGIAKDESKAKICFEFAKEYHVEKATEYLHRLEFEQEHREENNKPSIFERSNLDIIAAWENEEIEYKETFSLNTRTGQNNDKKIRYATVREVAGFLNSRDGVLLIGVSDAQIVTGVECDGFEGNGDKYALKINDVIMSAIGDAATASCVKIKLDVIEDKTVCRIECKKSKKPVYYIYQGDEKLFIRVGSSTKEPKPSEWDKWKDTNFD